jgi:sarcosine oxidase
MQGFDVIVVGLGAAGSSALYHLAKRGVRALGIDRFSPPHTLGSTHGDTRVTRLAIGEGEQYTPLAVRSHALWRELEAETGETLLTANGGLIISSGATTAHTHVEHFFDNTLEAARKFDIAHELLDAAEIRRRFPQFKVGDVEQAYLEKEAGFVRPERCVAAHLRAAERRGATIRRNERVVRFRGASGGVTVTTDRGTYAAATAILAVGPWLPGLIPELEPLLRVYRQTLFWFAIDGPAAPFEVDRCPIFIWEVTGRKHGIYGFPAIDGANGGVKIATEQFESTDDPEAVRRDVTGDEVRSMYEECVAPYLSGVSSRCLRAAVCLYTVTPDFGFVLDRHPTLDRVILASPCSGHGFKHSPALGEALAAMATGGETRFDLSQFALSRLAPNPA